MELHRVLKPEAIMYFSDHHLEENHVVSTLTKEGLFFVEYPVACYAGSAFKQNLHPEGAKFRNTPQLTAVIGILKILPVYLSLKKGRKTFSFNKVNNI